MNSIGKGTKNTTDIIASSDKVNGKSHVSALVDENMNKADYSPTAEGSTSKADYETMNKDGTTNTTVRNFGNFVGGDMPIFRQHGGLIQSITIEGTIILILAVLLYLTIAQLFHAWLRPDSSTPQGASVQEVVDEDEYDKDPAELHLTLTMYSELLVTFMYKQGKGGTRRALMLSSVSFMALGCAAAQVLSSYAVYRNIKDSRLSSTSQPVEIAIWMLSQTGDVMPKSIYTKICGDFEEYEIKPVNGALGAPGSRVSFPSGTGFMDGVFFFGKLPMWTWDANRMNDDRSILDDTRYVMEEGFLGWNQGYALLFLVIVFFWCCATTVYFRNTIRLCLMIIGIPTSSDLDNESIEADTSSKDQKKNFHVVHMSCSAKILGFGICIFQFVVASVVSILGIYLLVVTSTRLELILNSLALVFILDLDIILYQGVISWANQKFLEDLAAVRYKSPIPERYRKVHRIIFPPIMIIFCLAIAFLARYLQISIFSNLFNNTATLCLVGGPSNYQSSHFAPATGMCESLLGLTCSLPSESGLPQKIIADKGSCVITDFDNEWAKDISKVSVSSDWPGALFERVDRSSVWDFKWRAEAAVTKKFKYQRSSPVALMRRICFSMYQTGSTTEQVKVDESSGEQGWKAPFRCRKDLFPPSFMNDMAYTENPWGDHLLGVNILGQEEWLGKALALCAT